jgi:regulator of replication initiation timing
VTFLLRLFSAFTDLERHVSVLERQVEWQRSDIERLQEENRRLQDELIGSLKKHEDVLARRTLGRTIHEPMPEPVEVSKDESPMRRVMTPRQRRQEADSKVMADWLKNRPDLVQQRSEVA